MHTHSLYCKQYFIYVKITSHNMYRIGLKRKISIMYMLCNVPYLK